MPKDEGIEQELDELFGDEVTEETDDENTSEVEEVVENQEVEEAVEEVEEKGEESPVDSDVVEEEGEKELSIEEQNALLIERINELSARIQAPQTAVEEKAEATSKEEEAVKDAVDEVTKFIKDDENLDDILDSKEKLNALLNKVATAAISKMQGNTESLKDSVMTTMPQTIMSQIQMQMSLQEAVKSFYEEHPQLASVKQFVGTVANELQAQHKDWSVEQIFKETAKKSYETLGIKKQAVKKLVSKGGDAAFVKGSGARQPAEKADNSLQAEIDELMDL